MIGRDSQMTEWWTFVLAVMIGATVFGFFEMAGRTIFRQLVSGSC